MTEQEQRLERIEDAILELATSVQDGEYLDLYNRIGEILFEECEFEKE